VSANAVVWSLTQQLGRQATNYVVFLILAVLLRPADFGVVALASVWLAFVTVFAELGLGAALIQRREIEPRHLSSAFVLNVALGAGLALLGVALAGATARFFSAPAAGPVTAALSINLLVNGFSLTQVALAQRELRFRELALRDLSASFAGGLVGIGCALRGAGVWSLVAQSLTATAVGTILLWRLTPWRPHLAEASHSAIRELWGYSSKIFSFSVFKFFAQNTDKLLVGYFFGTIGLGVYSFASRIVLVPVSSFVGAFGVYLFPRFSRAQGNPGAVRDIYLLANRAILSVVVPGMVALALAAPIIVPIVFGDKWGAAIAVVQILTAVAVAQSFMSVVGQLMKALGRPEWLLWWSVGFTVLVVASLAGGWAWGVTGMAWGLLGAHVVGIGINFWMARRLVPLSIPALWFVVRPAIAAAFVSGGVLWLVLGVGFLAPAGRAILGVSVGAACYGIVLWHLDRSLLTRVFGAMKRS
jgi:PST family polysaccharide transporter